MAVRERPKPLVELRYLVRLAGHAKVARVDQHVALRRLQVAGPAVRVGHAHNSAAVAAPTGLWLNQRHEPCPTKRNGGARAGCGVRSYRRCPSGAGPAGGGVTGKKTWERFRWCQARSGSCDHAWSN